MRAFFKNGIDNQNKNKNERLYAAHLTQSKCLEALRSYMDVKRLSLGGIWGLSYFFFFFLYNFKTCPHVLQLFRKMQQCSLVVRLQKCVCRLQEPSPNFLSAWGSADNDWFFFFEWTYPFNNIFPLRLMFSSLVRNTEVIFKRSCMLRSVCLCVHKLMWHL